jgi:hypothetical protein
MLAQTGRLCSAACSKAAGLQQICLPKMGAYHACGSHVQQADSTCLCPGQNKRWFQVDESQEGAGPQCSGSPR